VSPDFKSHEIMATGIRFPVAMRFNQRGDLFATDQEGATWVPNVIRSMSCCISSAVDTMVFRRGTEVFAERDRRAKYIRLFAAASEHVRFELQ